MIDMTFTNDVRREGRLDVVKLANKLGLKVRPFDQPTEENALIEKDGDGFVIRVNPKQSIQRQRFSIAHEIAHFEMHKDEIERLGSVGRKSANSLSVEQEEAADEFAAELLMPKEDVKAYIELEQINHDKPIERSEVEKMAKRYDVSLTAMIHRLRELDYYVPFIAFYG